MPNQKKSEDFYIGYLPHAPRSIAVHLRKFIFVALACGALAALLFVIKQKSFAFSVFEFLQPRSFEGMISLAPYPTLSVLRPGKSGGLPTFSRYLLVAEGKHGALPEVSPFNGKRVKLQGTLIYRDDQTMIELAPNTIALLAEAATIVTSQPQSLGTFTLAGEIVDSKCFLGVMNPGEMKTHQACAVRCIAGGSPPILVVRNQRAEITYLLLVSSAGRAVNEDVLTMVARPVEITGEVWQHDNLLSLRADPKTYRVLESSIF
ncbi:hypothetical protein HUU05_00675 [candidate division KSB1 bacterium]|nr:hypothetical protein [candidate division KSB1 bacterium]